MDRRTMLGSMGAGIGAIIAGCVGGSSDGSSPQYDEEAKEDLLLTLDDFPEGWIRDDEVNDNFDQVFVNGDDTVAVMGAVEIYDEIDGARERLEDAKSGVRDPQEYDIGDEAFWDTMEDYAATLFRHSNAVGQVAAMRQTGIEFNPDQTRSQEYAKTMFEGW